MGDVLKVSNPESALSSLNISGGGLKGFQLDFSSENICIPRKVLVVYDWVRYINDEKTDEAVELCNQLKPLAPFLPTFQASCLQPIEID